MIEKILHHYKNPRNRGILKDADYIIKETIPSCGDLVIFYFKLKDDMIFDVKFEGYGCITSIALADIISEIIKNKRIDYLKKIDENFIVEILGEKLPKEKEHSIVLILNVIRNLVKNYERNSRKDIKV